MMEFKNTANIADLRALWKEAFQDNDNYLDLFFSTAYSEKRSMAAFIDNELAGALYWFDCVLEGKKTAYIYAVATAKKHRRKGVCAELLRHTHLHLQGMGYSFAILVPSEPSLFAFYEKQGYKTCGFIDELTVQNSGGEIEFRKISAKEYFILRKAYLKENSVNLIGYSQFLDAQYDFFVGADFIFSKHKSGSFFTEFLGDTSLLPLVISLLGLDSAKVRAIGNSRPFCMGIALDIEPLRNDIYFPFAFD